MSHAPSFGSHPPPQVSSVGHGRTGTTPPGCERRLGIPMPFQAGQFAGQTIRAELHELQKAENGRKYALKDRRPVDPPPVVELRLFRVLDEGTNEQTETEFEDYNEVQCEGLMCHLDLFITPGSGPPSMPAAVPSISPVVATGSSQVGQWEGGPDVRSFESSEAVSNPRVDPSGGSAAGPSILPIPTAGPPSLHPFSGYQSAIHPPPAYSPPGHAQPGATPSWPYHGQTQPDALAPSPFYQPPILIHAPGPVGQSSPVPWRQLGAWDQPWGTESAAEIAAFDRSFAAMLSSIIGDESPSETLPPPGQATDGPGPSSLSAFDSAGPSRELRAPLFGSASAGPSRSQSRGQHQPQSYSWPPTREHSTAHVHSSTSTRLDTAFPGTMFAPHTAAPAYFPFSHTTGPSDAAPPTQPSLQIPTPPLASAPASRMRTTELAGATFVQAVKVTYEGRLRILFVFPDVAVKAEGTFVLRYRCFDLLSRTLAPGTGAGDHPVWAECYGGQFRIWSSREFPGQTAPTALTEVLVSAGIRIARRVLDRRRDGGRRRGAPVQPRVHTEDEHEDNDINDDEGSAAA